MGGNGNGNGSQPPSDQDGWSRVDQVMDGSAPGGMPGNPVDENFVRACPPDARSARSAASRGLILNHSWRALRSGKRLASGSPRMGRVRRRTERCRPWAEAGACLQTVRTCSTPHRKSLRQMSIVLPALLCGAAQSWLLGFPRGDVAADLHRSLHTDVGTGVPRTKRQRLGGNSHTTTAKGGHLHNPYPVRWSTTTIFLSTVLDRAGARCVAAHVASPSN